MFVIPRFDRARAAEQNAVFEVFSRDVIQSASELSASSNSPVVMKMILGEIKKIEVGEYGYIVRFRGMRRTFLMSDFVGLRREKSFRNAWRASLGDSKFRAVALAVLSATRYGHLQIEDMVLMQVNQAYIPIESSYEGEVADTLIQQGRSFIKPLRYDHKALVLPDFFLLDASGSSQVPMEIYGMSGIDAYERRKREKRTIYLKTGLPHWEWEPKVKPVLPPFPPKRGAGMVE